MHSNISSAKFASGVHVSKKVTLLFTHVCAFLREMWRDIHMTEMLLSGLTHVQKAQMSNDFWCGG